mgnify:CR=1 FL=1
MKQFKKRTLALVLASTITVVGAFGAENFKNSLMSLRFEANQGNAVKLTMLTKRQYKSGVNVTRKDANTYVIMLPETNCEIADGYEFGDNVESVDVSTMPYTKSRIGYTKITVKTVNNTPLYAKTALFLTDSGEPLEPEVKEEEKKVYMPEDKPEPVKQPVSEQRSSSIRSGSGVDQTAPVDIKQSVKQFQTSEPKKETAVKANAKSLAELEKETELTPAKEKWYVVLGIAFALFIMAFFWFKAKDQMEGLVGEDKYDISDEPKKPKKQENKAAINTAIKNLDKKYSKPVTMPVSAPIANEEEVVTPEVENVVDLDELLQQQGQSEESDEENSALEDFLSSFSFEDEDEQREKAYEECINNDDVKFTGDDVEKISTLMDSEISDDVKKHASEFMDSSELNKKPSPLEILEKLVMTYVTEQNVTFTNEDVDALYKLINVEIDNDFLTDLRTNPELAKEMQEEIEKQKSKPHKTSELLTLNVKDILPDLSEALKKQGGRRIESEAKPQVVYYSEGYEVSTLKLNSALPDLTKEINNKDAYKVRPSDEFQIVDNSYEVQTMSISGLPDLKDVMANPEKYETPEAEPEKVDEEALLNNIMNVSFKPFDDGTREFEVLNDFEDENTPTRSDMQEEFNQFDGGFEIVEEEELPEAEESEHDDFVSLYDNNYVDLDSEAHLDEPSQVEPLDESTQGDSDKLLQMIKDIENRRKTKNVNLSVKENVEKKEKPLPEFCDLDGEKYSVVSGSYFTDDMGCYLAKNENGYTIIGFTGEKTFRIKHYEKLNVERMQSRMSEKLEDGTQRYIIRIGIHKFILNVKPDDMEFVMDLC